MTRPLLVIDGDSFAHRSYHALPKTIRRRGNKGAGAILGFANFLLRLHDSERPRVVLVAWDSFDEPTYRNELLPAYQGGRDFDDELVEQLEILPDFVAACGFANAKAPGYEADDFLAAAVAREERRRGTVVVASGDRDAFQLASARSTIIQPIKAGQMARVGPAEVRERYGVEPTQVPDFIALRDDASDRIPGAKGVWPRVPPRCCERMAHSTGCWRRAAIRPRPKNCVSIVRSRPWTSPPLSPRCAPNHRPGNGRRLWLAIGT